LAILVVQQSGGISAVSRMHGYSVYGQFVIEVGRR
jgi:hypothetical protein